MKNKIFGANAAPLCGSDLNEYRRKAAIAPDNFAILRASEETEGEEAPVSSIIRG